MANSHALLKSLRNLHLWIGIFISPALLFFAFTGALQTFGLHENARGSGGYKAPKWAMELGQLHKKQTLELPQRKPEGPSTDKAKGDHADGDAPKAVIVPDAGIAPATKTPTPPPVYRHGPMKLFFLLVALSLMTSTLTGLYMSYKYNRNKWIVTAVLIAGIVVPLLLLPF